MGQGRARGAVGPAPSARPRHLGLLGQTLQRATKRPAGVLAQYVLGAPGSATASEWMSSGIAVGDLGIILAGERSLGGGSSGFHRNPNFCLSKLAGDCYNGDERNSPKGSESHQRDRGREGGFSDESREVGLTEILAIRAVEICRLPYLRAALFHPECGS